MKKLLVLAFAAVAGAFAKRKIDQGAREQALWQQATDPVDRSR